jgi:hypothetical protein
VIYYGWTNLGAYGFLTLQNEDFENISKPASPLCYHTKASTCLSLPPWNILKASEVFHIYKNEIALKMNRYIYTY